MKGRKRERERMRKFNALCRLEEKKVGQKDRKWHRKRVRVLIEKK